MNKKDREQLEIFNKKIDYLVKESVNQSIMAKTGISVAYFAISVTIMISPTINFQQMGLMIGTFFAGIYFIISGFIEGFRWKRKYEKYIKNNK